MTRVNGPEHGVVRSSLKEPNRCATGERFGAPFNPRGKRRLVHHWYEPALPASAVK